MEIIDKIKNILNSLEDIKTVMYESAFGANLRVDRKEAPFAIMYTVADYQLDMSRNLKEGCNIEIFFAERGKLGDTGDNDQVIIDRTMGYARQFLAVLRQEKSIVIENDPVSLKSAYGRYDAHLVGVSVELQLRDRQAHCIDYEEPSIKTLTITENGEYDVTQYGRVIVNVAEPETDLFYIKNETQTTGTLTVFNGGGILKYSFDAVNWSYYDFTTHPNIPVNGRSKIYWKGVRKTTVISDHLTFSMDVNHSSGGNIMSIVDEVNYDTVTKIPNHSFEELFIGDVNLTDASQLNFGKCTSTGEFSMYDMFRSCTSLTKVPDLSGITSIGNRSMAGMFFFCSSLTEAYAPNVSTWDNTEIWLRNVAPTGTLYCPSQEVADLIPDDSISGCPTGWVKRIIQ